MTCCFSWEVRFGAVQLPCDFAMCLLLPACVVLSSRAVLLVMRPSAGNELKQHAVPPDAGALGFSAFSELGVCNCLHVWCLAAERFQA
jgi:hypothetical protein